MFGMLLAATALSCALTDPPVDPAGEAPPSPQNVPEPVEPAPARAPDVAPPRAPPTPAPADGAGLGAMLTTDSGDVSLAGSIAVGALGAGFGAVIGAAPALLVLVAPPLQSEPLFALVALATLPSVAALSAGLLATLLVVQDPSTADVTDVLVCSAVTCALPMLVALVVAGGGGLSGCGTSVNCCGNGANNELQSPALAHAGGAAIGAFVGASAGAVAMLAAGGTAGAPAANIVRQGVIVGAVAGVASAMLGGAIGGIVGANWEDASRSERHAIAPRPRAPPVAAPTQAPLSVEY